MAKLLELDARTPIARNTSRVAYLLILSVCGRAAKRTFPTPPKNKLALPVGSRALSHRFAPTKHRNARNEDRQIPPPELFYSSLSFPLSFHSSVFSVSRTSVSNETGTRSETQDGTDGPTHFTRLFLQKSRVLSRSLSRLTHRVPLLRSAATKLGRLAEVTRGCTVYGRIYPG